MCRSSELANLFEGEEGGTMSRKVELHLGADLSGQPNCVLHVPGGDGACAPGACEQPPVLRSPNSTRQRIRCPLRILLTACLGIFCTFVTYLCLPEDCSDNSRSVSALGQYQISGRLVQRGSHVVKRSPDPRTEGFWEQIGSDVRLSQYCNFVPSGVEGQRISQNYDLLQVHLLISPGQRSQKSSVPGLPFPTHSCRLDNKASESPEVWNFMQDAITYEEKQHNKGAFKTFELYPFGATCRPGQLLPDGIHQLILLGKFLKNAYQQKFEEVSAKGSNSFSVHITSLPEEVQYQTVMAFAQGFLHQSDFLNVQVKKATENFCLSDKSQRCQCPYTDGLKEFVERAVKTGHYMFKPGHTATNHLAEKINRRPSEVGSVMEISQSLLLRACQSMKFFCKGGTNCLDASVSNLLVQEGNTYWQSLGKNSVFRSYSKIHSYPFLGRILNFLQNETKSGTTKNVDFFLYSAEHEFSTYILSALGYEISRAPSYANRLAIEIFRKTTRLGERKHFLRVLHDGIDVTGSLPFCKDKLVDGLCKVKYFLGHLKDEVLSGKMSYEKACNS